MLHQVGFAEFDVGETATLTALARGGEETRRTFHAEDGTRRSDDFRQIRRGVTRAGTDIDHPPAMRDANPLPAFRDRRTPNAMLQTEPRDFIVMGAEDVVGFGLAHERKHGTATRKRYSKLRAA